MPGGFSYRPPTARGGKRRLVVVSILIVFVLLLDAVSGGKLRGLLREGASAITGAGSSLAGSISGSGFFATRASLEQQIQSLTMQLAQNAEDAAAYQALKPQYEALAQMTHLAKTLPGVTAPIVSSLAASPYGTFSVGAGGSDGVAVGDLVLSNDGFVIGDVSDVAPRVSLVSELSAPGRTTRVVISGANVLLNGAGGENAQAQVPHGITVHVGDIVRAPSLGDRPVGVVGHVTSSSASAYSDVIVTLPVNLNILRFVYVTPQG